MADQLEFVTYCGLHCNLCAARSRIPQRAAALQQAMADEGWAYWGQNVPGFEAFWKFLANLKADGGCPGCRAEGGFPGCEIRVCARERGVELCAHCPDFPCEQIQWLAARYPMLIADNMRLQAVGLERWLEEQAERARRGVVYADTRHEVDESTQDQAHGSSA